MDIKQKRLEARKKRRGDVPMKYRSIYDRAMQGKSRKAAIHSFCLECVDWLIDEIRDCTGYACPLYEVRPYKALKRNKS